MQVELQSELAGTELPRAGRKGLWPGLICFLPKPLLVVPMVVQWIWLALRYRSLSLPSAANPAIAFGGLAGESKNAYFVQVQPQHRRWLARTAAIVADRDAVRHATAALQEQGLDFPVIAKPDIGWCGFGVRRIDDRRALEAYVRAYPGGESLLVQEYVDLPGEAGLFYVRRPGEAQGRLLSLTVREPPHVVGDGTRSVRALVARDELLRTRLAHYEDLDRVPRRGEVVMLSTAWSHRMGGRYRDFSSLITPELQGRVDAIARGMPDFHVARFDVRFATLAALRDGEFKIIEINGAGSEAIEFFDRDVPFFTAYRGVLGKQAMVFALAAENRARGVAPCGWRPLLAAWRHQQRLLDLYPAAN